LRHAVGKRTEVNLHRRDRHGRERRRAVPGEFRLPRGPQSTIQFGGSSNGNAEAARKGPVNRGAVGLTSSPTLHCRNALNPYDCVRGQVGEVTHSRGHSWGMLVQVQPWPPNWLPGTFMQKILQSFLSVAILFALALMMSIVWAVMSARYRLGQANPAQDSQRATSVPSSHR